MQAFKMSEETDYTKIAVVAIIFIATLISAVVPDIANLDVSISLIMKGLFIGTVMAIAGYAKAENLDTFEYVKFFLTVVTGAITGALTYAFGWTPLEAQTWLAQSGIVIWIEYILKIIVRRLRGS